MAFLDPVLFRKFCDQNQENLTSDMKTYPIDYENFEIWVNRHPEGTPREVAKRFRDASRHVSFTEFFRKYDDICSEINEYLSENEYDQIFFYVNTDSSLKKSNFWLALYMFPRLELPVDKLFIGTKFDLLTDLDRSKKTFIIVPDDASYSGSQMRGNLFQISNFNFTHMDIILAVGYISQEARDLIKNQFPKTNILTCDATEYFPIFKIDRDEMSQLYEYTKLYTIYFDHKLADTVSIYQLQYGIGLGFGTEFNSKYVPMSLIKGCKNYEGVTNEKLQLMSSNLYERPVDLQSITPNMCPFPPYKKIMYTFDGKVVENINIFYKGIPFVYHPVDLPVSDYSSVPVFNQVSNYSTLSASHQQMPSIPSIPSITIDTKDVQVPAIQNDLSIRPLSYKNIDNFLGKNTNEMSRCTLSSFPIKRMIGKGKNGLIYELKGFAELEDEIMVKVMDNNTLRNKWEVYYSKRLTNTVLRNRSPHFPMVWLDDNCGEKCDFIDISILPEEDRETWKNIKEKSCYLMFLEKFNSSLDRLIVLTKERLVSFVMQMMMALSVLQAENLVHNDCHPGNVLIKHLSDYEDMTPYIGYQMGTETLYVKHENMLFALSDFGMMSELKDDEDNTPNYLPSFLTHLGITHEEIQSLRKSVHLDMAVLLKSFMMNLPRKSEEVSTQLDRMCRFFVTEALNGGKRNIVSPSVISEVFGVMPFRTDVSPGDVLQTYDYNVSSQTYGYSFIKEEQQLLENDVEEVYRPKFKRDKSDSIIKGVLNVKILNRFLNECGLLFTKEGSERDVVRNVLRKILMNGGNIRSLIKLLPRLPFNKDDKRQIANGAYGTIYAIDETSVGKMMIVDHASPDQVEAFLEENITHLLLYCLSENDKNIPNPFPRIKGIYTTGEKPFVIMEKLDSTLYDYFTKSNLSNQVNQLIVICYLLYNLQIKYGFTHGDMHCQNIMVSNQPLSIKIDRSEPDSDYVSESLSITLEKRPYFIDLGMTCAELTDEEDIYFATMVIPNEMYKHSNYFQCGNPSHDMRILIASLIPYVNPALKYFFIPKFEKYVIDKTKPFSWNFYDDVAHMNDPDFQPMSLINSLRLSFLGSP